MSVSVLASTNGNAKWQPSVLQLLPFSKNDAGSAPSAMPSPNTMSYSNDTNRGFPVLAVTRSDKENKLRSKSASAPNNAVSSATFINGKLPSEDRRHRLLRASSERLTRHQAHNNEMAKVRFRAKSDYGIHSDNKKVPGTVRISVNDINNQILGKNNEDSDSMVSSESGAFKTDVANDQKLKPLPKPALKQSEGRWPQTTNKYWRSSNTTSGDIAINRQRIDLELQTSSPGFRRVRRVKLNVNELPRSKTPIAENDPDKLNMKHVIAFLQSSSKDNNDNDETQRKIESYNEQVPLNVPAPPIKRMSNSSVVSTGGKSGLLLDHRQSSNLKKSPTTTSGKINNGQLKEPLTPHRYSSSRQYPSSPEPNSRVSNGNDKISHLNERNGRISRSDQGRNHLHYSEYNTVNTDVTQALDQWPRPQSRQLLPQTIDPSSDIHIPPSIRKIRDSGNGDKPFRLHRFLTLVPNGSGSLLNMPEKSSSIQPTSKSRPVSKETSRSAANLSKIEKRSSIPRRSHSEAMYYLNGAGPSRARPKSKNGRRSKSKSAHFPSSESENNRHVNKIIRLPRAHFEADSDDDMTPFSTVPNARNRRALTLSAHGRSIAGDGNFRETTDLASRPRSTKDSKVDCDTTNNTTGPSENQTLENANHETTNQNNGTDVKNDVSSTENKENAPFNDVLDTKATAAIEATDNHRLGDTVASQVFPEPSQQETFLTLSTPDVDLDSPKMTLKRMGESRKSVTLPSPQKTDRKGSTDQVRLSLRKERNRTREHTYMFDMEGNFSGSSDGVHSHSPSSYSSN